MARTRTGTKVEDLTLQECKAYLPEKQLRKPMVKSYFMAKDKAKADAQAKAEGEPSSQEAVYLRTTARHLRISVSELLAKQNEAIRRAVDLKCSKSAKSESV